MRLSFVLAVTLSGMLGASASFAGDLVYQPVNPNFGGNPFNGSYLLGTAQAQNLYSFHKSLPTSTTNSPSAAFKQRVESALLGKIADEISNQILGENAKDSGTFSVDGTSINFKRVNDQIQIVITDTASGGQTEISIPAPTF